MLDRNLVLRKLANLEQYLDQVREFSIVTQEAYESEFRNVLVHNYDEVDTAIVVTILKEHLDDFLTFRDAILAALS